MILHNERLFFLFSGEFIILRDLHGEIGELLNYSPSILGSATSPSVENMQTYLGWKPCSAWVHSVLLLKKIVWNIIISSIVCLFGKWTCGSCLFISQTGLISIIFVEATAVLTSARLDLLGDSDWSGEYMTLQKHILPDICRSQTKSLVPGPYT